MFNRTIYDTFLIWSRKENRKPLVVRGARQVGKTVVVSEFARKHFQALIYLNLEKSDDLSIFQRVIPIPELIQLIQLKKGQKIIPGSTLLFIDEIQNSAVAMTQLRYFHEEMPNLHVVAAGSLLEIKIREEGFSFPVGRIDYAYMYPVTFPEYLMAMGDMEALEYINGITLKNPVPSEIHQVLIKKFFDYVIVGGMPEAVAKFSENRSFIDLDPVYESILTGFRDDVYKYSSKARSRYIQHVIEHAPKYAGKRIKYENFAGSGYRSREMKEAFDTLEKAMIVHLVASSSSRRLPIEKNLRKMPKMVFLDTGLVNYHMGSRQNIYSSNDISHIYEGCIAEQITGQILLSLSPLRISNIAYWFRDKPGAHAEIDYLIAVKENLVPIEVKSGTTGILRSMHIYMAESKLPLGVRVYSGELMMQKVNIPGGGHYQLLSVPFYILDRLEELLIQ